MKIRRWSLAGVAVVTLVAPSLVACGGAKTTDAGTSPSASPTAPADPKQVLLASTQEIKKGNFRFALTGDGVVGGGQIHEPSKSAEISMKAGDDSADFSMDMGIVYVHPSSWVKIQFGGEMAEVFKGKIPNSGKYQHLDQSKVKDVKGFNFDWSDIDPAGSDLVLKGITKVEQTGEGAYSGTVDISGATEAGLLDEATIKALGVQATSLPFTAKLDPQGRLTELAVEIPAAGESQAHKVKVTYSAYGAATAATPPSANQVVEAPASVYEMLNS